MQQRVTAILVVRSGVEYLDRTLAALSLQTRRPEAVVAVDLGSDDGSRDVLAGARSDLLVGAPADATFGRGVSEALDQAEAAADGEWLWLLAHDNAPEPDALARLLGAVEIAPSVAVAGPKLMQWRQPDVIAEFGESMTRFGASVRLVEGELDQAQHDVQNDVLGVAAGGMLVRRSVWNELDGFDGALPSTDAALDFSVRARLAGHRVVVVPEAKVASAGGPQHFGRRSVSEARRARIARAAQLHRRLVYSPPVAVLGHWLSLVPLAVLRSIGHLLAKHPGSIGAEFRAAFRTAVSIGSVARARRRIARTRRVGWGAITPLRITRRQAREQLAERRDLLVQEPGSMVYRPEPIAFVTGGGLWAIAVTGVLGFIAFATLFGQSTVAAAGLLPLSSDVATLWSHVGWGWREIGAGFTGAADPFAALLALLGTTTFWQPSLSVVVLYLVALPLASVGAWFCARRLTDRAWLPALTAVLWAVAPPFLASLDGGQLGAVAAHLLLPWLIVAMLNGVRSWSSAAAAALLFAAIAASAPLIAPALLLLWVGFLVVRPTSAHRVAGIPIPAAVMFAPLVVDQLGRANPIGLLAAPGVPSSIDVTTSGIQLAFASPTGGSNGWTALLSALELPGPAGPFVMGALLLPLAALAVMSLFVRGTRRAIPALALALIGFVSAVVGSRLDLVAVGADVGTVWPGPALSMFWLGLLGAALVTLDALDRTAVGSGVLLGVASVLVALPLLSASALEVSRVQGGPERILPALVDAEAESRPGVGTLIVRPMPDSAISAELQRGRGATLDDQSTLDATATGFSPLDERLATLAGNLVSRSGYDFQRDLAELAVEFVVLESPATDDANDVFVRAREALDGNRLLVPVGETPNGLLWRASEVPSIDAPSGPANTASAYGVAVLIGQGLVLLVTVLLAVPTTRRRKRVTQTGDVVGDRAATFDEDTDD